MWSNTTESHSSSLPIARNTTDAIRAAASNTRVYMVYKGTNNRLKLGELTANGAFSREIGELFTNTQAVCNGLVWDPTLGALRALITVGANQFLYRVDPANGGATGVLQLPSGGTYTGLTIRNGVLLTQGAGNTDIFQLTITGASVAAAAVSGKTAPINGANQRGMATYGDNILFLQNDGSIRDYNYSANTSVSVTWPAPGSNYCGLSVFGGNILATRATDTALGLGTSYLLRNTNTSRLGTSDHGVPSSFNGSVPIAKRDNHHVYAVLNNRLYLVNLNGTLRDLGSVPAGITCIVWAPIANELYAIAGNQIYTLSTTDGSTTTTNTLRSAVAAIAGFENGQGRLTVWSASGSISNVFTANGLVNAGGVGNLGANQGGFFSNGHYWFIDSTGNVKRKGPNLSDAVETVLDPLPIVNGNRTASGLFEVNGVMYTYAWRSASRNIRPLKFDGIFPTFYRQGSIVNLLTVPDVQDREFSQGYSSTTIILPEGNGGKGPYTHQLTYQGSTTLPTGFTFTAATRTLVIAAGISSDNYDFVYKVTDSEQPVQSVSNAFRIAIDPPVEQPPVGILSLTSQTLSRNEGDSSTVALAAATGGTLPYTYELGIKRGLDAVATTTWGTPTAIPTTAGSATAIASDPDDNSIVWIVTGGALKKVRLSDGHVLLQTGSFLRRSNNATLLKISANKFYHLSTPSASGIITMTSFTVNQTTGRATVVQQRSLGITRANIMGSFSLGGANYLVYQRATFNTVRIQGLDDTDSRGRSGGTISLGDAPREFTGVAYYNRELYTVAGATLVKFALPLPLASQSSFGQTTTVLTNYNGGQKIVFVDRDIMSWSGTTAQRYPATNGRSASILLDPLPAGMTFEAGINTLELDSHTQAGTYNLSHKVTDGAGRVQFANINFTVNAVAYAPLTVPDATFQLTKASTGRLEFNLPAATGGRAPIVYSTLQADGSDLPSGITEVAESDPVRNYLIVDRNDIAAGTTNLRLTVTDSRGVQATSAITVQAYGPVALPKPDDVTIQWNQRRTQITLPAATGGSGRYNYELTGLPGSLSFDTESRVLTVGGDLTGAGTTTVTYKVIDRFDSANTASQSFTIQRLGRPNIVLASALQNQTWYRDADGSTSNKTVTLPAASGGTAPYTYNLTQRGQATLPAGVTFNKDTRLLTVDPDTLAVGAVTLTYTAADSTSAANTFDFTVTIGAAMTLAQPSNIVIDSFTASNVQNLPQASGGSGNFVYRFGGNPRGTTTQANPPAIQYSNEVPKGSYTVQYQATDSISGDSITRTFVIRSTVEPSPALQIPPLTDIAYVPATTLTRVLPEARGGKSPYTYNLAGLPAGASFDADTRTLTLTTQTATGTVTLTYSATDSDNNRASQSFTLSVVALESANDLILNETQAVAFAFGTQSNQILGSAQGGNAPYTYTLTKANGDPLPAGFRFAGSLNQLDYNNAAVGSYVFLHTVTDSSTATQTLSRRVTVRVAPAVVAAPPIALPSIRDVILRVGQTQELLLPTAAGGAGDFFYQVYVADGRHLPTNAVWNENTRRLSLRGGAVGDVRMTYRAIDANGDDATVNFNIITSPDAMQVLSRINPRPTINCEPVVVGTLDITGGVPPYNFEIDDGGHNDFTVAGNQIIADGDTGAGSRNVDITVRDSGEGEQLVQLALTVTHSQDTGEIDRFARTDTPVGERASINTAGNTYNEPITMAVNPTDNSLWAVARNFSFGFESFTLYQIDPEAGTWTVRQFFTAATFSRAATGNHIDISFTPSGVLYAMISNFEHATDGSPALYTIDTARGRVTKIVDIGGVERFPHSFTINSETRAYMVGRTNARIYDLDLRTGRESPTRFEVPAQIRAGGDHEVGEDFYKGRLYFMNGNADIAALDVESGEVTVVHAHIGTRVNAQCMARRNNDIYYAYRVSARQVQLYRIDGHTSNACELKRAFAGAGESLQLPENNIKLITYEGIPFNIKLTEGANGTAPYTYRVDNLPRGLRFDPLTQRLTGTLEHNGNYAFTYGILDAEGKSFVIEYTIENRKIESTTTRFNASFVYTPDEVRDLFDADDPLTLDVSFMVRYRDSFQLKVEFVEFGGEAVTIRDWQKATGGSFTTTTRGSAVNLLVDSNVLGELFDLIQAGRTGVFVISVRAHLVPGDYEAEFSSGNMPVRAIQDEFSRLDIQDHSKERIIETNARDVGTAQLQDEAVTAEKLSEHAVYARHLTADAVTKDKIADGSVDEKHLRGVNTAAIANRDVDAAKIASGTVEAKHLNANFLGDKAIAQVDRHAVTESKLANNSVGPDALHRHGVDSRNIASGGVTGAAIPEGALNLSYHAPELAVPQTPVEDAVSTEKIMDRTVRERHLSDDLQRYTKIRRAAADLRVDNPDNVRVGEPCGVRLVNGRYVIFRLTGDYPTGDE